MTCPYALTLTHEEVDALEWLTRVFEAMEKKQGPNAGKARTAAEALNKLVNYAHDAHVALHEAGEKSMADLLQDPDNRQVLLSAIAEARLSVAERGEA